MRAEQLAQRPPPERDAHRRTSARACFRRHERVLASLGLQPSLLLAILAGESHLSLPVQQRQFDPLDPARQPALEPGRLRTLVDRPGTFEPGVVDRVEGELDEEDGEKGKGAEKDRLKGE